MKLKKTLIAAAVATTMALPYASANASAIAVSELSIYNFFLWDVVNSSFFSNISIQQDDRTGTIGATLNGVSQASTNTLANSLDLTGICLGDCSGFTQNTPTAFAGPATSTYASADMFVGGMVNTNGGATGYTGASVVLEGPTQTGGSNSLISNAAKVTNVFTANATSNLAMVLNYDLFMNVATTFIANEVATADVFSSFNITIKDITNPGPGNPIFNWSPDQLNVGFGSVNGNGDFTYDTSGFLSGSPFQVIGGHKYSLNITQSTSAIATDIPEPASLALTGLGLLGLGALRRRKAEKVA